MSFYEFHLSDGFVEIRCELGRVKPWDGALKKTGFVGSWTFFLALARTGELAAWPKRRFRDQRANGVGKGLSASVT